MFTADQLVSVDESSKDGRTLYRRYGWSPRGETAHRTVDFPRGERWSLLPALTIDGYIAKRIVKGSIDGLEFLDFILEDVTPQLPKMNPYPLSRSVLLLDNCSIHKMQHLVDAVTAAGCKIRFLPPYAPELNPIEESFAAVKAALRRHFRYIGTLSGDEALEIACDAVTGEKAKAWFAHSGYYP
ncbi:related to transposase, putative-Phytophthora infestans [Serendipita indica DSM 11827]|uniref:Related to transposase, putative-Phytophthora infestans n=1 Tax=Serendipita indica (strain DSM 11827) TaxID=1109443 RepID=G4TY15_SERID|nr:related to transposase, putative-Phytophthora infestans [Serendipita indica DSM 11827]